MDKIQKLAKEILSMNIGDFGPTSAQEAYVYKLAVELATELTAEKEQARVRVRIPNAGGYEYIYVSLHGAWRFERGDDESGDPSTLNLYPLDGMAKIEFETDEVDVEEYKPPTGFNKAGF